MLNSRYLFSWLYLILAIFGAVLTMMSNIEFMRMYGPSFDLVKFFQLANSNPASSSLSKDLLIGAGAFTIWIVRESKRLEMRNLWLVILSTFTIAFAFAGPLFLCLRERRLIEINENNSYHQQ